MYQISKTLFLLTFAHRTTITFQTKNKIQRKKPNIKRRFADDDPSDDDDDSDSEDEEEYHVPMRGGGKGFRMMGGKGLGKQLRHVPNPGEDDSDDDDSEDDSVEEEEDAEPVRPVAVARGGGKQLRPP